MLQCRRPFQELSKEFPSNNGLRSALGADFPMHSGAVHRVAGLSASLMVVLALSQPAKLISATTASAPQRARSTRPPVTQTPAPPEKTTTVKGTPKRAKRTYSASASRTRRARQLARERARRARYRRRGSGSTILARRSRTFAPRPQSSTTPKRIKCSGSRTPRISDRSRASRR